MRDRVTFFKVFLKSGWVLEFSNKKKVVGEKGAEVAN